MKTSVALVLLFFINVTFSQDRFEFGHQQMGTQIRLVVYAKSKQYADSISKLAFARIDDLNQKLSNYSADSELNRLCENPQEDVVVSNDLFAILKKSVQVSKKTAGSFDITAGPIIQLWKTSRKTGTMPPSYELKAAMEKLGYQSIYFPEQNRVRLNKLGLQLDLGGIGKGFAADEVIKLLDLNGITSALVDMGGDIRVSNPPPGKSHWLLAFAYFMENGRETIQKIKLDNAAVATSGDLYQFVEIDGIRYSHIVDPLTGMALTNGIQVTTIAKNATMADAYASALSVMGIEKSKEEVLNTSGLEAFMVTNGNEGHQLWHSRAFQNYFTDD